MPNLIANGEILDNFRFAVNKQMAFSSKKIVLVCDFIDMDPRLLNPFSLEFKV